MPTYPGVYITELNAYPSAIVGVATAVAAFIGYTEKAEQNGQPLTLKPVPIASLADYIAAFGGDFAVPFALTAATGSAKHPVTLGGKLYDLAVATPAKRFNLFNSLRLFYANGGGNTYIISVGNYTASIDSQALLNGLDAVRDLVGPTMLAIPDAVLLADPTAVVQAMVKQSATLTDRVALLDVWGAATLDAKPDQAQVDAAVAPFRKAVAPLSGLGLSNGLSYGMAYFPFLATSVVDPTNANDVSYRNFAPASAPAVIAALKAEALSIKPNQDTGYIDAAFDRKNDPTDPAALQKLIQHNNQTLIANVPALMSLYAIMAQQIGILPPSGAMAGAYTANDATNGVWNAPANIALNAVDNTNAAITDAEQGSLNVPLDGLAINAVRDFVGRGPLVWGARTLDGNSPDWRYIQVRRLVIYIEQSIKQALNGFASAPNDGQTWTTVTTMVGNFLTGLWSQGGLMGAKPSDAFTVQCGLGSTMTAQDILDGYMIVQVTLQIIRPAEFTTLTIKQQMQGVA
jgi:phage tail sheath protein FI